MMRPRPASWFEILAVKDDLLCIAEALAVGGCAEFETPGTAPQAEESPAPPLRERFLALERRYREWWPQAPLIAPRAFPATALARAVANIEAWAVAAEQEIATLVAAGAELAGLGLWHPLLASGQLGADERAALAAGGRRAAAVFLCPPAARWQLPEGLLARPLIAGPTRYLFAVGTADAMPQLAEQITAQGGRQLTVPEDIAAPDAAARLADRGERCRATATAATRRLAELAAAQGLASAVAEARCACWGLEQLGGVETSRVLCRLTGWTGDPVALRRALAGRRALLRFPAPPLGLVPPLLLHNPWWARPYEVFSRLLGMPERDAADPSALVALIFPLLFGYMFGDFGQGLLLVAAGVAGGRRWPLAKLLVPAGLAAAAFGLLFGSVFSLAGVLAPLWLDPLHDPLPVLLLPLLGGGVLLLGGFLLGGVEAYWRGQFVHWLRSEGGALVLYLGGAAALVAPEAWLPALLAAAGALALAFWQGWSAGRAAAILGGLAASLEQAAQLAINTISFVRVGAFAIAHAGLSAALVLLGEAAGSGSWPVMVLGNIFIVALEVLVVSVQTTRLLLFEFFTRFFVGSGRAFRPAPPLAPEIRHET